MSQKHQNDQKCQKHEKRPKMTKKHQKYNYTIKYRESETNSKIYYKQ